MVAIDEFASPIEGMRHLKVDAAEVELSRDFEVFAMDSKEKIVLSSDYDARAYKKHLDSLGIRASAFLTSCDFNSGDQEKNVRWVARVIDLADIVDMDAVRVDSAMSNEQGLDFETRVRIFADTLGTAIERTAGSRVALGIENHGFQGNNLAFQLNVYKAVGSDRLGATMDTGNFYWRGYPLSEVYGILNILAPNTKHTHLKNIKYPSDKREVMREAGWEYDTYVCPIDEGDIDHGKVLAMLAAAGYRGDVCLEDESLGHYAPGKERIAVLERDIAHLKTIISKAMIPHSALD
jgi:sugar phosphate isomerase/epimerase